MIDWVWNYGIPIFLTCCASAGLLAFALVLLSDTMTNPIQYLRNYLNACRMRREREAYHRKLKAKFRHIELSDEEQEYISGRQVNHAEMSALYSQLIEQIISSIKFQVERTRQFSPGGISTPMTHEGGEWVVPMPGKNPFRVTCDPDSSIDAESVVTKHPIYSATIHERLEWAIAREDYEEAARLRDEIKKKGA